MLRVVTIIATLVIFNGYLSAQCPDRDSLWNRLKVIRGDPPRRAGENLKELYTYLDQINSCAYKKDSTHAFLIRMIGAKHATQKDFVNAIHYYKQSVEIIRNQGNNPAINPRHLLGNYYWLSVFYDSLGNVSDFRKALDSCITTGIRLNSIGDITCIRALYSRAEHFYDIGDYHRSIEDAMMCEKLAWEYAKRENRLDYDAGSTIASSSLGWNVQAHLKIEKYDEASSLLSNKVEEFRKNQLTNYIGMVYGQLAEVQIQKGNYPQAISFLNKEYFYNKKSGYAFNCKQSLNALGYEVYFKGLNQAKKALSVLHNALAIKNEEDYLEEDDLMESLNICGNIANIYASQGNFDQAFRYFQKAFDYLKLGADEKYIFNVSSNTIIPTKKLHYLVGLMIDKGDAYRKKYEVTHKAEVLQQAIQIYSATDRLLETIKTNISDLKSKLYWRSNAHRLYESAISASYLLNDIDHAFFFFEKSRAVLLQDQLNEQRWLVEKDAGAQIQLQKKLNYQERVLINAEPGSAEAIETKQKIFHLRQQLDQLQQSIRSQNPLYFQSFIETEFIDMRDVRQQILKDHQALVEIFTGDSAVYVLVVTPEKSGISRVNKKDFENKANQFIAYVSDFNLVNRNYRHFTETASGLYQMLFGNNLVPKGRIIISPGGSYFPFEALITSGSNEPVKYFVQDHAVSYTYSARFLMHPSVVSRADKVLDFLGMAPETFNPQLQLAALSGSVASLQNLKTHFSSSDILFTKAASRNNFLNGFADYRIVQLYTHASENSPTGEPVIYFTDSVLYLSDLMRPTRPATQLIILSACETGLGPVNRGEGVFSFNRGFAAVGIPSSIMNLWSVENKSTYKITELFYKHLSRGLPIDMALQQAKIEFMETVPSKAYELPYFWAAPVLAGKTGAITLEKKTSVTIYVVAGIVLIGLLIFGFRKIISRIKRNS